MRMRARVSVQKAASFFFYFMPRVLSQQVPYLFPISHEQELPVFTPPSGTNILLRTLNLAGIVASRWVLN